MGLLEVAVPRDSPPLLQLERVRVVRVLFVIFVLNVLI